MIEKEKNVLQLLLYITKLGEKYYVAIDGNLLDIEEFGLGSHLGKITDKLEEIVRDCLKK